MTSKTIIGIAASLRSKINQDAAKAQAILDGINEFGDLVRVLEKIGGTRQMSNSDLDLIAALYGVKSFGYQAQIIHPEDYYRFHDDDWHGLVLSTPVYFGDNSSVANRLFEFWRETGTLQGKAFGVCSVGAKRNGGQETTNVLSLMDALDCGAFCVGNGPKTSQYGGTSWAGDKGSVRNDDSGIETCVATGTNVARAVSLLDRFGCSPNKYSLNVLVIGDAIKFNIGQSGLLHVADQVQEIFIDNFNSKQCLACSSCPDHESTDFYRCRLRDKDDFKTAHEKLLNADLVILTQPDNYRLRVFLERMRCIRRDDLKMGYIPFFSFGQMNHIRAFIKFLRQDMIILPPITDYAKQKEQFARNIEAARIIKRNKAVNGNFSHVYVPVGYGGQDAA